MHTAERPRGPESWLLKNPIIIGEWVNLLITSFDPLLLSKYLQAEQFMAKLRIYGRITIDKWCNVVKSCLRFARYVTICEKNCRWISVFIQFDHFFPHSGYLVTSVSSYINNTYVPFDALKHKPAFVLIKSRTCACVEDTFTFQRFVAEAVVQLRVLIAVRCGETVFQLTELHASPKTLLMSFPSGQVYKHSALMSLPVRPDLDHGWICPVGFIWIFFFVRNVACLKIKYAVDLRHQWNETKRSRHLWFYAKSFAPFLEFFLFANYGHRNRNTDLSTIWYRFWLRWLHFGSKSCDFYIYDHWAYRFIF